MSASALRRMPDAVAESEPKRAVFDTDVVEPGLDLAATLRAITTKYGKTYQRLLLDLAKASFGPGRLSYDEFIGLRLFDDAWVDGADITPVRRSGCGATPVDGRQQQLANGGG